MDHVTLPPELERFAAEAIAAGRYRDMDELLRTGVGLLQRAENSARRVAGVGLGRRGRRRSRRLPLARSGRGGNARRDPRGGASARVNPDLFAGGPPRAGPRCAGSPETTSRRPRALLQAALHGARRIAARPLLGRLRTELLPAPYRFWRVAGFPYLLVYNAARQPPRVVRFVHMARDLGPLLADLADVPDADEAN